MKHFFRVLMLSAAVFLCCSCGIWAGAGGENADGQRNVQSAGAPWQYVDTAMGTVVRMTVYTEDQEAAELFFEQAMDCLAQLEQEKISWRLDTSEVYQANESAGSGEGFLLSEDMAGLLEDSVELSVRSEGALDVTLGSVTRLWDIDRWAAQESTGDFQIPSEEELQRALRLCGSQKINLAGADGLIRLFLPEGMQLDLGAVGKGLAMEKLYGLLEESSVTGAVISLGGGILTYGVKPDGSPWRVGVVDPFDTAESIGILTLEGQWCVSTSGDYERYVEVDGVRYHHILDPKTGMPASSGVRGVTILTGGGLLSDGLSTACFILGPDKGMELAGEYGAESLFVMADGTIRMSEGMEAFFNGK